MKNIVAKLSYRLIDANQLHKKTLLKSFLFFLLKYFKRGTQTYMTIINGTLLLFASIFFTDPLQSFLESLSTNYILFASFLYLVSTLLVNVGITLAMHVAEFINNYTLRHILVKRNGRFYYQQKSDLGVINEYEILSDITDLTLLQSKLNSLNTEQKNTYLHTDLLITVKNGQEDVYKLKDGRVISKKWKGYPLYRIGFADFDEDGNVIPDSIDHFTEASSNLLMGFHGIHQDPRELLKYFSENQKNTSA